jgi:hypothetical protein
MRKVQMRKYRKSELEKRDAKVNFYIGYFKTHHYPYEEI